MNSWPGINGARAQAVRDILGATSQRMDAYDIAEAIRNSGRGDLLRVASAAETVQTVLRNMEARGEVDRVRNGHRGHHWGLT